MENVITIFTDGSADNRISDCGGAAAVIRYKSAYKEITSGSWSSTTNNRMELLAIIIGLEAVKSGYKINLTSDSQYSLTMCKTLLLDHHTESIVLSYMNGDLLSRLNKVIKKHRSNLTFNWVKGHIGVKDNERCDVLAGQAAVRSNPTRDIGSGISKCPNLGWYLFERYRKIVLDNNNGDLDNPKSNRLFLGKARKMSKKEITQILKDKGWANKEIKEYEIDTSFYNKPI